MSAPYWKIRAKAQDAMASFLVSSSGGKFCLADDLSDNAGLVPVYTGYNSLLVETYPVICVLSDSSERYLTDVASQDDNTRLLKVSVIVRTAMEPWDDSSEYTTAEEQHNELTSRVFDILNDTAILTGVAAAGVADLTIQQIDLGNESTEIVDNNLQSTQEVAVVASMA